MAVRWVLGAGFALLLALVAFTLAQPAPRAAGSNFVPEAAEVVKLDGAGRHCQAGEPLPADAAGLRLLVGTYGAPAPRIAVTVHDENGSLLTSGTLAAGAREGHVVIPVDEVEDAEPEARVCLAITTTRRTVLYGVGDRVRLEWMRAGEESWFSLLPTIVHRGSLGRADFLGGLWLFVAGLLVLAAAIAAARLVLRDLGGPA